VLSEHLTKLIPQNARVLDVGCGDGLLDHLILQKRPDLEVRGIDVLVREQPYIPVDGFDGRIIPYADESFDAVIFIDVLHHTDDPTLLLREAARVARTAIVIKDHTQNGPFAGPTLRFLDWVGNARHGVALPYNYWPQERWRETFERLGLKIGAWKKELALYPPAANWLFGRSLHFIARLDLNNRTVTLPILD
jgi:SAM-dependent methyltransferase